MSMIEALIQELTQEADTTRRVLERVPGDQLAWKPHAKSNTIGWNACHLAEIPGWAANILTEPFFDMNPSGSDPYKTPEMKSRKQILDFFDANVAEAKKAIAGMKDSALMETWQFKDNGTVLLDEHHVRGAAAQSLDSYRTRACEKVPPGRIDDTACNDVEQRFFDAVCDGTRGISRDRL